MKKKKKCLPSLMSEWKKGVDDGFSNWTEWSLTRMTDVLWQCVVAESREMRKEERDIYRVSARKMKQRFDPRYYPMEEWHMSCVIMASGQPIRVMHSSQVRIEPSSHQLWTVIPWTFNRHPMGPSAQRWWTHGVKGQLKRVISMKWA